VKTVAIYHKSVPNGKNLEKIQLLQNFSQGVRAAGDTVFDVDHYSVVAADVGVIQGWVSGKPDAQHTILRNNVIIQQKFLNKFVVCADSNLFLYANTDNPLHYLRYSFNDVFPNQGIYCDTEIDPMRWTKISQNLNIHLKPYRAYGDHILILLQRNGGWSMSGYDVQDWAISVIDTIRSFTDRPIVIRAHPGDKAARTYLNPDSPHCRIKFSKRVRLSNNTRLTDDLVNCWAAINYNSSPAVGAAIEGIPIFVTDPIRSQSAEIANRDLSQIENPMLPDRQRWVERLSMFHWNFNELRSGECWSHMRKFIS
jgi:hypothetical protein